MIAIHHSNKTDIRDSFSSRWISYCESRKLSFILVDCYDNKILEKLRGVSVLLWHAYLRDNGSFLFATNLIRAIEKRGIKCFPNLDTYITYDNKINYPDDKHSVLLKNCISFTDNILKLRNAIGDGIKEEFKNKIK